MGHRPPVWTRCACLRVFWQGWVEVGSSALDEVGIQRYRDIEVLGWVGQTGLYPVMVQAIHGNLTYA